MKKKVKNKRKINWKLLIGSFVIVYLVALVGSIFSSPAVNSEWYNSVKPLITPPNWVFPVVWNILFFLIFLSLYFSLSSSKKKDKLKIEIIFGVDLLLNVLWSFIFFYLKDPLNAFFDLILLWASILFMIYITWRSSKLSSWLLVPYSLWVGFAGILNYLIAFG